jgi:hypothetical protein
MKRHVWLTLSASALLVSMWLVTVSATQSAAADADAKAAILGLAEGKGKAADVAKNAPLEEVMHLFKLRTKKGLGVGDKPGAITPDGIEAKLIGLGKKTDPADIKKNGAAYEKMAKITAAIADVTMEHTPKQAQGPKTPAAWKKFVEEMKAGAKDLTESAKDGDAAKVKTAANKTVGACNECHTIFRD